MKKFKTINGYTKKQMIRFFKDYNTGKRCILDWGDCLYSDGKGNHCAVGCFIPDDHPGMNFVGGVRHLLWEHPELESVMPLSTEGMLKLQMVHDTCRGNTIEAMVDWVDENVE